MTDLAISLVLSGSPDLPSAPLQALYRITGRSTVELRQAIEAGHPLFTATLFGRDHIDAVPRLEKTMAYLDELGLPFALVETADGEDAAIDRATLNEILHAPDGAEDEAD